MTALFVGVVGLTIGIAVVAAALVWKPTPQQTSYGTKENR